ncbi:MAG: cobyrinate a,c-diamide synthase [Leptospirales bacterium]|nr:cobyrinate a,c-diamide synthase [Leptospirales bacterium]
MKIPTLVIAGTGSGVGKTSISIGITAALQKRGLNVRAFKVGPDFLDPSWLSMASGEVCFNLDSWMTGKDYVTEIFARSCENADIAIIEGVMGLFDGASPDALVGSTAEIAQILEAPVLLIIDSWGVARSAAAMVRGFATFEPGCKVAGVIANYCGSEGHAKIISQALQAAGQPPLLGFIERNALPSLPDRHLGLYAAVARTDSHELIEKLSASIEKNLNLDALIDLARASAINLDQPPDGPHKSPANVSSLKEEIPGDRTKTKTAHRTRFGVARDEAFHFYYPDNLELLRDAGAQIVYFSPLNETALPADLDGIILGGGYPEDFAEKLSDNISMLQAVRDFARAGNVVYAECGGLMYLSKWIETISGDRRPMVGILPFGTRMLPKRKMLGYIECRLTSECLIGKTGDLIRGHEFHYSEIVENDSEKSDPAWKLAYEITGRRGAKTRTEGYSMGTILASYAHLHFGSNPAAATALVQAAARTVSV